MKRKPDPIASAMAFKRWSKTTPEQRKAISVELVRWRQVKARTIPNGASTSSEAGALTSPLHTTGGIDELDSTDD